MTGTTYNYIRDVWFDDKDILVTYHSNSLSTVNTFSAFEVSKNDSRIELFDDKSHIMFDCNDFDTVYVDEENDMITLESENHWLEISRV